MYWRKKKNVTDKESALQRSCQRIIRKYGGYVFKNNGNIFTEKGRPDLVACVKGKFVGIELKRENHMEEVSDAQKIVGRQIQAAGGIWIATDDANVVEVLMIKLTGEDNVV